MPKEVSPLIEFDSGDADLAALDLSEDALTGIPPAPTNGVVTVPLARLTVLMCVSSVFALLNILAAASELENRGGNWGRK